MTLNLAADWRDRHPGTQHFGALFDYGHLPPHLQDISAPFAGLANALVRQLPDGPELSAGLRKLVEAKDCFVRAAVAKAKDTRAAELAEHGVEHLDLGGQS